MHFLWRRANASMLFGHKVQASITQNACVLLVNATFGQVSTQIILPMVSFEDAWTSIGHLRVHFSLYFKARLSAKSLSWQSVFTHTEIGTNYHNKNFALRRASKERNGLLLRLRIAQLPESKNNNDNFLQTCGTARSDYSKSRIFISWPCLRERVKEENFKRQNSFKGYFTESSDRNTSGKVIMQ